MIFSIVFDRNVEMQVGGEGVCVVGNVVERAGGRSVVEFFWIEGRGDDISWNI